MATFTAQVPAPGATTAKAASDGKKADVVPELYVWVLAAVLLVIAGVLAANLQHQAFQPTPGFSVFAVMYIVAQAIERLQDPFVPFLGRAKPATEDSATTPGKPAAGDPGAADPPADARASELASAQPSGLFGYISQTEAISARDDAVAQALGKLDDGGAARKAALAQRTVDQIRANLTLLMWGISSALAMLASGLFGLYLLQAVGVKNVPIWADIVVTGLAIGGGTKPLHDLISNISTSKTTKQDPAQTA